MQANYEEYAEAFGPDVIEWDGLLLDGWLPLGTQPSSQPIDQADAVFRHVRSGSNSPFWLSDHHFRSIPNIRHSRPRPALRKSANNGSSLDHLVGGREKRRRVCEAEHPSLRTPHALRELKNVFRPMG
jgi:hypothetical protein